MLSDDKLKRINELAKKKKETGLTEAETAEQQELRQAYLHNFRRNFKKQVEGIKVLDPEGTDITPEKVQKIQKNKNNHKDDNKI